MRTRTLGWGAAVAVLALTGTGVAVASQRGASAPPVSAISSAGTTVTGGPAAADQAAAAFVQAHHAGSGTTRVLATEPDDEQGVAVYDVRILAPDNLVYEVHVRRSDDTVLWASRAEDQSVVGMPASHASGDSSDNSPDVSGDSPDSLSVGHFDD